MAEPPALSHGHLIAKASPDEVTRFWRVRQTVVEMLQDRSYKIDPKFIIPTREELEEKLNTAVQEGHGRNALFIVADREKKPKYDVSDASAPHTAVNGTYVYAGVHGGTDFFANADGAAMFFQSGWKISTKGFLDINVVFTNQSLTPTVPEGQWTLNSTDMPGACKVTKPVSNSRVFVFFLDVAPRRTIGSPPIRVRTEKCLNNDILHVIFVLSQPLTKYGRDAIASAKRVMKIEEFHESELVVNITHHDRVPKHIPLTAKEKKKLLLRYTMKDTQLLPRILITDPVAKYFGLNKGDIVMIIRESETIGRYTTYRVVV